jgi:hypothetical protein
MGKKANGTTQMENDIDAIIARTDKENPKPADIAAMNAFLDTESGLATVKANEPTRATIHAFINNYFDSELKRETQRRNLDLRREELHYANESAIVRMLIDQVLLCHMRFEPVRGYARQPDQRIAFTHSWDLLREAACVHPAAFLESG